MGSYCDRSAPAGPLPRLRLGPACVWEEPTRMCSTGIPVNSEARLRVAGRPALPSTSTSANFCLPSESTSALMNIPSGSLPLLTMWVADPQFIDGIPTAGSILTFATPANSPEGFESLTPCSTTSAMRIELYQQMATVSVFRRVFMFVNPISSSSRRASPSRPARRGLPGTEMKQRRRQPPD